MTEQYPTPTPLRGLRLLPDTSVGGDTGVADTDTAPDTRGGAGVAPDTALVSASVSGAAEVVPMTAAAQAGVALRHWGGGAVSAAHELWLHPGRLIYVLWHGRAGSMSGLRDRAKSREWVPEELEGTRAGKWITFAGVAFYVMVAPVKAFAKSIDAVTDKPLRAIGLAALILTLLFVIPL